MMGSGGGDDPMVYARRYRSCAAPFWELWIALTGFKINTSNAQDHHHTVNIGSPTNNEIICEKNGIMFRHNYCANDEWCTGATDKFNATYNVASLCVKGEIGGTRIIGLFQNFYFVNQVF